MIHAYKMNGYNIILDQNSGCVHSVDEVAYDIITRYKENTKDEIKAYILGKYSDRADVTDEDIEECFEDIESLIADGEYCFAGKGEYGGADKGLMSLEVGKRALDFLIEQSGTRKNLEVDFFGGEPLLNWDVCKELVKYGREQEKKFDKNFRFTLTTNGVLVDDEVIDFCNKEMSNVVLSLCCIWQTSDLRNYRLSLFCATLKCRGHSGKATCLFSKSNTKFLQTKCSNDTEAETALHFIIT